MPSATPTAGASSTAPGPALGMAIDDYLRHGSASLNRIRAVLVNHQGNLVAERYYDSDTTVHLGVQSVTWSVISTLVGIALTKGDLTSLDQTVGDLFPDQRSSMSKRSAAVTIRQLLTMSGGWTDHDPGMTKPKVVERILATGPDGDPGTFAYTHIGPHLLSAALVRATGMSTLEYARRELFEPLGISSKPAFEGLATDDPDELQVDKENSFQRLRDADGVHVGAFGLALTAQDMVKIGQLWLNDGVWQSRRFIDADYISAATTNQVPELEGLSHRYGYLWFVTPLATHDAYSAFGPDGQLITVVPDLQAVIVVSARRSETPPGIDDLLAMIDSVIVPRLT